MEIFLSNRWDLVDIFCGVTFDNAMENNGEPVGTTRVEKVQDRWKNRLFCVVQGTFLIDNTLKSKYFSNIAESFFIIITLSVATVAVANNGEPLV